MPRPACPLPLALTQAARRFEQWRRRRSTREIPGELWSLAAELAGRYGVSRTARSLGLSYPGLKQRVEGATEERASAAPPAPAEPCGFLELLAGSLGPKAQWVVELEDAGGVKLRIQVTGGSPAEVAAVGRLLLEGRA